MKFYFILSHLVSSIYLGGGIILGLSYSFTVDWTQELRGLKGLWKTFSLFWILLFLPLYFLRDQVFPWHELQGHRAIWFQWDFVLARLALYFGAGLLATALLERRPYLTLILFFLMGNFFSYDWAMSINREWYSNMFGLIYLANGVIGALALMMLLRFRRTSPSGKLDLSHLLMTVVIIWLYLTFCQFLIIWMGNLPREVSWYLERNALVFMIVLGLKVVPLLLVAFSRERKTQTKVMVPVAVSVSLGSLLEIYWALAPKGPA